MSVLITNPRAITSFPPMYNGQPAHSITDPFGLRPWLRRIRATKNLILEWDNADRGLKVWAWPVVGGVRVPPSELNDVFKTHEVQSPCCLCASENQDPAAFSGAAIFLVTSGQLAGEYVAACARKQCKYWIFIERLYTRRGLPVKVYSVRDPAYPVPPTVTYTPEADDDEAGTPSTTPTGTPSTGGRRDFGTSPNIALRRQRSTLDNSTRPSRQAGLHCAGSVNPFIIESATPTKRRRANPSTFSLLMELDDLRSPGITEAEFHNLFKTCKGCKLYMTTRAFTLSHKCRVSLEEQEAAEEHRVVIDLTGED